MTARTNNREAPDAAQGRHGGPGREPAPATGGALTAGGPGDEAEAEDERERRQSEEGQGEREDADGETRGRRKTGRKSSWISSNSEFQMIIRTQL